MDEQSPHSWLLDRSEGVLDAINSVIDGKQDVVRVALEVLLAQGHLLLEDVPGVGKTVLAKTLARTIDCSVSRVQFTPDLLPTDVTGVSVFNQGTTHFEFRPGPVFANIVIGDEINRASAKTQSALLECMEERQVSVDGATHLLEQPFMVVATQNPLEMEGTYPLPEAQRDRFMARISMGYPDAEAEFDMLTTHQGSSPLQALRAVVDLTTVKQMIEVVNAVHVSNAVKRYIVALATASREHRLIRLGASPRSLIQLLRAAKAHAGVAGRNYVTPDDVAHVAQWVLPHRLLLTPQARIEGLTENDIVAALIREVPVSAGDPELNRSANRSPGTGNRRHGADSPQTENAPAGTPSPLTGFFH